MKRTICYRLALVLCFVLPMSWQLQAQPANAVQGLIQQFAANEQLRGASIGFCAIDATSGETIASHQSELNLTPASVLKLVTTAAALDILGADYRFITQFLLDTTKVGSQTHQRLIIRAGGDPTLFSHYFSTENEAQLLLKNWATTIARQLPARQLDVLQLDLSAYDQQYVPNAWIWEDMGNYYGAGIYALAAYDNSCTLHFISPPRSGQPTTISRVSPAAARFSYDNQVLSSDENRDKAYVFGSPFDNYRVIRGSIPKNRTNFRVKAALPSPPQVLAEALCQELQRLGVKVLRVEQCYEPTTSGRLLLEHQSPSLKQIVEATNRESVNLFAEHLVKQLAYERYGQGNFRQGLEIIDNYWRQQGVSFSFLDDGSGLSRLNAISAGQLCSALHSVYRQPKIAADFFGSLPAAPGGTLWYFSKELFPKHCLRAKSGSMTRIRSFAGELRTSSGKTVLFTLLINNFSVSQNQIIRQIQRLLSDIRTSY